MLQRCRELGGWAGWRSAGIGGRVGGSGGREAWEIYVLRSKAVNV